VGLIARVLEETGISTVCFNMRREVAQNVKPPRTLFVKFPFGAPLGPAGATETQRGVILEALEILATATEPGIIVDSPRVWKQRSA
jgi:D-proline reductase (dithiol) PrdB